MKFFVDLNSDIGEGYGAYKMGMDEEIMKCVTSVNIACGWHAGDPLIMDKTIKIAKANEVAIGAHPGYPDLLGFGRRKMVVTPEEAKAYMLYQLGALSAFAKTNGKKIQHMKLHGAFYNMAAVEKNLADAVLDGIEEFDKNIIVMTLSGSYMAQEAKRRGMRVAAFVKDPEEEIARVIKMVKTKKVTAVKGEEIDINADSICVHGDNPKAIEFVDRIRKSLIENGIEVKSLDEFIK